MSSFWLTVKTAFGDSEYQLKFISVSFVPGLKETIVQSPFFSSHCSIHASHAPFAAAGVEEASVFPSGGAAAKTGTAVIVAIVAVNNAMITLFFLLIIVPLNPSFH